MDQKFYICKRCGNIIAKVKDVGVPVVCCGEPMSEIVPGDVYKRQVQNRWWHIPTGNRTNALLSCVSPHFYLNAADGT